jgi:hypothetical protein
MKKKIIVMLVFLPLNLIAQESEKFELSLGGNFLYPVSTDFEYDYSIGGSAAFGYIMSPIVVFSGSLAYYYFHSEPNPYSLEQSESILNVSFYIKRIFSIDSSCLKPYLLLQVGFFIPLGSDADDEPVIVPELCGSAGLEFLVSKKTYLFVDVGYCLGIGQGDPPNFILCRVGFNFHI